MPFSPKSPQSMIGTFAAVLIFTMFKELYEDIFRHKQDNEVNNKTCDVLSEKSLSFEKKRWKNIKIGDIVKIEKDQSFPADILLL